MDAAIEFLRKNGEAKAVQKKPDVSQQKVLLWLMLRMTRQQLS